jgi:hypothetical protein
MSTLVQYHPFRDNFTLTAQIPQSNGAKLTMTAIASEDRLRGINDADINRLVETAKLNPTRAHALPPMAAKFRGRNKAIFAGFKFL